MDKEKIIELLKDDEHYYGDFGKQFLSNSNIMTLMESPELLGQPTEVTMPLVFGGYFHTCILEPDKLDKYKIIDSSTRNTKKYKELSGGQLCLLQKEIDLANAMKAKIMKSDICRGLIQGDYEDSKIEYEIPNVKSICDNNWKGKADILNHDEKLIVDIKTTSNIDSFKHSAYKYNYDSQAYIYKELFGYDFVFLAVDKKTLRIKLFECSDTFYEKGYEKVQKASSIYDLFYKQEGFKPENYIEILTL